MWLSRQVSFTTTGHMEHRYVSAISSDIVATSREYRYWEYGELIAIASQPRPQKNTNKMQGVANKMLLVDAGSMKDLISQ